MSSSYAGADLFPTTFVIPDDSDPPTAASFNTATEALGDRTAYLKARLVQLASTPTIFLAGTTLWTCPPNVLRIRLVWCGGGGGGAGGGIGSGFATQSSIGGGGGGGATLYDEEYDVTPGVTYEITVGAGGSGGAGANGAALPNSGAPGGNSIFKIHSGTTLRVIPGGRGGFAAISTFPIASDFESDPTNNFFGINPGGAGFADGFRPGPEAINVYDVARNLTYCTAPGDGGDGICNSLAQWGPRHGRANYGSGAGAGGSVGADVTSFGFTYHGGGPGGGGGGAAFRPTPAQQAAGDGHGGSGGAGVASGTGFIGVAGNPAASDCGGGGGGGGGGGSANGTGGNGGNGGDGGNGQARLTVVGVS